MSYTVFRYLCPKGHVDYTSRALEDLPQLQRCWMCDGDGIDVAIEVITDPSTILTAAEAERREDLAHILADQALVAALRPSAPDLVQRYECIQNSFWYI